MAAESEREAILPILQKYHIPTSMIVLELTESTAINAPALMEHHIWKNWEMRGSLLRWMIMEPEMQTALILCGFRSGKWRWTETWHWHILIMRQPELSLKMRSGRCRSLASQMVVEGVEKLEQSEGDGAPWRGIYPRGIIMENHCRKWNVYGISATSIRRRKIMEGKR